MQSVHLAWVLYITFSVKKQKENVGNVVSFCSRLDRGKKTFSCLVLIADESTLEDNIRPDSSVASASSTVTYRTHWCRATKPHRSQSHSAQQIHSVYSDWWIGGRWLWLATQVAVSSVSHWANRARTCSRKINSSVCMTDPADRPRRGVGQRRRSAAFGVGANTLLYIQCPAESHKLRPLCYFYCWLSPLLNVGPKPQLKQVEQTKMTHDD